MNDPTGTISRMTGDEQLQLDVERLTYWVDYYSKQKGWTADQLAVYAGLSRGAVYGLREGTPPRLRTIAYLAAALGVETAALLQEVADHH